MENKEIIVVYKEVGKSPLLMKISNNTETLKVLVGGEIELLPYENVFIVCKKDRESLKPNISLNINYGNAVFSIRGNILIINKDNDNFKSLSKEQALKYAKLLVDQSFKYEHFDKNGKYLSNKELKRQMQKSQNSSISKNNGTSILNMILEIQRTILKYIQNNS